jgi:transglutaminase-like putative cysteine protease
MMSPHKSTVVVEARAGSEDAGLGSGLRAFVISVLLYGMALEWFRPLLTMSERTEVHMRAPFYIAFALYLLPDVLRFPLVFGWLLRIGVTVGIVVSLFFEPLQGFGWVTQYAQVVLDDISYVLKGEYYWVGAENRTLLFLTGWMMLLTSVQSLILHRKRALWLVAASAAYLAGMQWWLALDTGAGIVRVVGMGLVLTALVRLPELEHRFGTVRRGWPAAWLAVAGIMAAVSVGASWGLARPHPALPEPKHELPPMVERLVRLWSSDEPLASSAAYRGAAISRTGYGDSDFQLGGPVKPDESIAFMARTSKPGYWRGEAKTLYDGKGWIQVEREALTGVVGEDLPIAGTASSVEDDIQGETVTQEIWLKDQRLGRILFGGGSVQRVDSATNAQGDELQQAVVRFYPGSGKLQLESGDSPLVHYRLTARLPVDSNELAAQPAMSEGVGESGGQLRHARGFREEAFSNELRLPVSLPERVKELGVRLTAGQTDPLLQAKAIESYLRENYTYSLDEPTYPQQGQDFTDHFLFGEKVGYCDHFSTAMAVLLRTAGIPSRWVKGFAPGEAVLTSASSSDADADADVLERDYTVVVRNKHAHSWVEAYIAPYGWVPFEPTPGFAGMTRQLPDPAAPEVAMAANGTVTEAVLGDAGSGMNIRLGGIARSDMGVVGNAAAQAGGWSGSGGAQLWKPMWQSVHTWMQKMSARAWLYVAACLIGVIGLIVIVMLTVRRTLQSQQPYRSAGSRSIRSVRLTAAMDRIWRQLFRKYGQMGRNQTPREYVCAIAEQFAFTHAQRSRIQEFVELYETVRYSAEIPRELSLHKVSSLRKQLYAALSSRHEAG